jgi:hypothetical protein
MYLSAWACKSNYQHNNNHGNIKMLQVIEEVNMSDINGPQYNNS